MISVCMASFNGGRYVAEQLASILCQLSDKDEVIISDDGSTDGTLASIRGISDDRIVTISGPQKGLVKNFENALNHASGNYIFLSDQDDVWLPGKVERMIKALDFCDLVVSDCKVVDASLKIINESFFAIRSSGSGLVKNLYKNSYLGCCMAFKKELLNVALPFPDGIPMHDWWLGLVANLVGKVRFLDEPLLLYRRYGNNATETSQKSTEGFYQQILWRLTLMVKLILRWFSSLWKNSNY